MIVVSPDKALKRSVKRLTTATGSSAEFLDKGEEMIAGTACHLVIYDARKTQPNKAFLSNLPSSCKILYILSPDNLASKVSLFETPQTTSLFCHNDQFDDDEFISSATKALRGDVFGLQKYFPWGVTTFTMLVRSYQDKTKAIDIMMSYAQSAGVRGPVRDRVQLVADELMMNALYHAPVDDQGLELYRGKTRKELAQMPKVAPIEVQYGCTGRYFGISVRDGYGSLNRSKALDYLKRAENDHAVIESKKTGAGLGLISVLQSVSKLIFNLDPGYSTEAIGIFDMTLKSRGVTGARSMHIFSASPDQTVGNVEEAAQPSGAGGSWLVAGALGALVAGLGTAYVLKSSAATKPQASLTVSPTPADANVTINGKRVGASQPWLVDESQTEVTIEVRKPGYTPWSKTLLPSGIGPKSSVFVTLETKQN